MKTAYCLSLADTHAPVSYWMSLPLRDVFLWVDVICEVKQGGKG